jgi:hypothetical protein
MILLSATMFILGLLAFLDTIFNYGNMFRLLFSGLLIVMSVWVFIKSRGMGDLLKTSGNDTSKANSDSGQVQSTQIENRRERKPQAVGQ